MSDAPKRKKKTVKELELELEDATLALSTLNTLMNDVSSRFKIIEDEQAQVEIRVKKMAERLSIKLEERSVISLLGAINDKLRKM